MSEQDKPPKEDVIRQQQWTEEELRQHGFNKFTRKKERIMARQLPEEEAPLKIKTSYGDVLTAEAGDIICYKPGETVRNHHSDYEHWPVKPDIFQKTYRIWEGDWQPTPAERHLTKIGCAPYYKAAGVWAKQLEEDAYLQSLEHEEPVQVESGRYVAIGSEGEPYSMGDQTFIERYDMEAASRRGLLERLLRFLRGGGSS